MQCNNNKPLVLQSVPNESWNTGPPSEGSP